MPFTNAAPSLKRCGAVAIGRALGRSELLPRAALARAYKGVIAMDQLIGLGLTLVMVLLGVGLGAVLSLALAH